MKLKMVGKPERQPDREREVWWRQTARQREIDEIAGVVGGVECL